MLVSKYLCSLNTVDHPFDYWEVFPLTPVDLRSFFFLIDVISLS